MMVIQINEAAGQP